MVKDKKLFIKINYDTGDEIITNEKSSLEAIMAGNIKGVIIAILILLVSAPGFYFSFFKSDTSKITNKPLAKVITHEKQTRVAVNTDSTYLKQEKQEVLSEQLPPKKSQQIDNNKLDEIVEKVEDSITINEPIQSNYVVRSQLTSTVTDKEPEGLISSPIRVEKDKRRKLYFYTEIKNMPGKIVYHNWIYNGKSMFKKQISVKGNRWRTFTYKYLDDTLLGDWKVKLTDSEGHVLHEIYFNVIK